MTLRIIAAILLPILAGCQSAIPDAADASPPSPVETKVFPVPQPTLPEKDSGADATSSSAASPVDPPVPSGGSKRKADRRPTYRPNRSDLDPSNPAFPILQNPLDAMHDFPVDAWGDIDWVQALAKGRISPRATVSGKGKMLIKPEAVIMKNTAQMPWVRFPHLQHTQWLACSNCHPTPFRETGNRVSMDSILRGKYCGVCHGKVAFDILHCERCHSVVHPGSPKAWW